MADEPTVGTLDHERLIKCVVWDLDNTLWDGVLLEGDELVLRPGIDHTLRELDARGVVQSVASKNDGALAIAKLAELGLSDYFLAPQIGWGPKSDAIERIAAELSISLGSLAFVDDDPREREEVEFVLPQVATVDAALAPDLLDLTEVSHGTQESARRRQHYFNKLARDRAMHSYTGSRREFLESLGVQLRIRPAVVEDLSRVRELTLRTSQLNTTGRVFSPEQLVDLMASNTHTLLVADMWDRDGYGGTVGLVLLEKRAALWTILLFVVSCRVLTLGIGGVLMSHVLELAKGSKARVQAHYTPTDRNRIMHVALRFQGFKEIGEQGAVVCLEHDLTTIRGCPSHVEVLC